MFGRNGILRRGSQTIVLATHAVHLVSKADNIILLGDKEVVYKGSYKSFPADLISVRDLDKPTDPDMREDIIIPHQIKPTAAERFVPTFHPSITEVDVVAPDIARQTGDSKIYKYYLKTTGIKHIMLFVFLGAICMGFTPAQSTKLLCVQPSILLINLSRSLVD